MPYTILMMLIFPFGTPMLYVALMLRARRALLDDHPTALSKALGFLVKDYDPPFFW